MSKRQGNPLRAVRRDTPALRGLEHAGVIIASNLDRLTIVHERIKGEMAPTHIVYDAVADRLIVRVK